MRFSFCTFLSLLAMFPAAATAQEVKSIVLPVGTTKHVRLAGDKILRTVAINNEQVVREGTFVNKTTAALVGLAPGATRVRLTAVDGTSEILIVTVPDNQLILAVGGTRPLQMTTKKPIRRVLNENDRVVLVRPAPNDPTTVLLIGVAPGRTRISLTDVDGKIEVLEFGR